MLLFSYGTLQQPQVQLASFGRLLEGQPDELPGFELHDLEILDEGVVATSGRRIHPIASPATHCSVSGTVYQVTLQELNQSDNYEVGDYGRRLLQMTSGQWAWVYVAANAE